MQEHALYFHIPFCEHRCAYCDFNTYAGQEHCIPAYVEALCHEIQVVARSAPEKIRAHTIFFGGGTPSMLTPEQFEQIFQAIHDNFNLLEPETSLEANPGTVSRDSLQELRRIGFNRISFGVQSAHLEELHQLERIHDFFEVIESVKWARQAGFDNLNLDLIFGLPDQSLERWQATVKYVVNLEPEHFSLYALTVEHGTPFGRWSQGGLLSMPDPDLAAEMYEWAGEYLEAHEYRQYEISNWARGMSDVTYQVPGFACKHNLQTWRNRPYLGFGAGAHGFASGVRYSNVLRIKTYIDRLSSFSSKYLFPLSPAVVDHHYISRREEMQETMLLGLRLVGEGVSEAAFRERFRIGIAEAFPKEVDELQRLGLVEWIDSSFTPYPSPGGKEEAVRSLRLMQRARLVANQVFLRFIGD